MFKTLFKLSAALFGGALIYSVGKDIGAEEARKMQNVENKENSQPQQKKESK